MKKKLIYTILFLLLLPQFSLSLLSQASRVISPYIQLQYFKNTDDQRVLQTTLTYSRNRMELPLPGMEISFFTGSDPKVLIAKSLTDSKGIARLELNKDTKLKIDKNGMWAFNSEFKGNDTIEAGTSEITVKDVRLEMVLTLVDTIRTITLKAFFNENGKEKPVAGEAVKVYVPRMFSFLLISELTLDDSGTASVEFPSDLPGDKEGNITLIAKFEENPTFGNVEKKETLKWGLPIDYSVPKTHRALWTKTAPRWMIYTLSVLLAGVWGHYLFALISLIRIKRDATKEAKREYKI
ncbi:MAG: hypothetical protein EPN88_04905 [Bacteroidetes bacterium]|nr:MAG: hypothetical protein EPN88_04905 [Bacteroidota bacterium]